MGSTFSMAFVYLAAQVLPLLAYIAALVLAIVHWRRHPLPSRLTLAAAIILLSITIVGPLLMLAAVRGWLPGLVDPMWVPSALMGLSVVLSLLRSIAYGLLLWAVFAGRRTVAQGFPVMPPLPDSEEGDTASCRNVTG